MMAVVDKDVSLILSGTGDVLEPEDDIIGIGSGGGYALAAARALIEIDGLDAETVARRAMNDRGRDLRLHQRQDHARKAAGLNSSMAPILSMLHDPVQFRRAGGPAQSAICRTAEYTGVTPR